MPEVGSGAIVGDAKGDFFLLGGELVTYDVFLRCKALLYSR